MALFLDVDGTLLDIAAGPDRVEVPPGLPGLLLRQSAQRSGRSGARQRPSAWRNSIGSSHPGGVRRRVFTASSGGAPTGVSTAAATAPAARDALAQIRPALAALARPGTASSSKTRGRASPSIIARRRNARPRSARLPARLLHGEGHALRLVPGKMVVEFQPRGADKGAAIAAFLAEPPFLGRRPVFVGDDVTDEDGFAEITRRGGLAIRVGAAAETLAPYALPSVAAVRGWLAASL